MNTLYNHPCRVITSYTNLVTRRRLSISEAPRSVGGAGRSSIVGGGQDLEGLKEGGGGDPNGEPDTMLNLRKTFAGIFGDMRS